MIQHAVFPVALAPAVVTVAVAIDRDGAAFVAESAGNAARHLEVMRESLRRELVSRRKRIDQRIQIAAFESRAEPVRRRIALCQRQVAATTVLPAGQIEDVAPQRSTPALVVRLMSDTV